MLTKPQCEELFEELLLVFAKEGVLQVNARIHSLSRKDKDVFCSFLFIRSLETDAVNQRLVRLI